MQITIEGEDAEKLEKIVEAFGDERKALNFSLGLFLFALRIDRLTLLRLSGLQPRNQVREHP